MNATTVFELSPVFQEALCCHEAFRRLGFKAEEIFFGINMRETGRVACITLIQSESDSFTVDVGPLDVSWRLAGKHWMLAASLWNTGPEAHLAKLWSESTIATKNAELVAGLRAKGIRIPVLDGAN